MGCYKYLWLLLFLVADLHYTFLPNTHTFSFLQIMAHAHTQTVHALLWCHSVPISGTFVATYLSIYDNASQVRR